MSLCLTVRISFSQIARRTGFGRGQAKRSSGGKRGGSTRHVEASWLCRCWSAFLACLASWLGWSFAYWSLLLMLLVQASADHRVQLSKVTLPMPNLPPSYPPHYTISKLTPSLAHLVGVNPDNVPSHSLTHLGPS